MSFGLLKSLLIILQLETLVLYYDKMRIKGRKGTRMPLKFNLNKWTLLRERIHILQCLHQLIKK